jgi:multicomponent Na+:H+ antiporter subunit D
LLTVSAVALIGLARQQAALEAALRYVRTALVGSLFYLLGVALVYSAYGSLDIRWLGAAVEAAPLTRWTAALMTLRLAMKTALFPIHFWLPPAHGNAPTPLSALLSALIIKAPFYFMLRLWFAVFWRLTTPAAGELLGGLGAAAIVWGSVQALRQQQLKLLWPTRPWPRSATCSWSSRS